MIKDKLMPQPIRIYGRVVWDIRKLDEGFGRAFTPEGFGNKMADWCREAGLPGLNSHGVRKAAAKRIADRGASTHALMAWFDWLDIKQAELYARDASRRRLAADNAHLAGTNADQKSRTSKPKGVGAG